jgi:hypothetical protein
LQKEEPDKLTEAEKAVVVRLARGEEDVRAGCQAIYYANIKGHVDGGRKAVEMTFQCAAPGSRTRLPAARPPKNRACFFRRTRLKPLQGHFSTPGSTTAYSGALIFSTAIEMVKLEVARGICSKSARFTV